MMGIYIKGMQMPKNCYQCRMVDSCQYLWKPYDLDDYSDLQNMVEEGFTRADNCPLVEVPPHGRLIDADKLNEEVCLLIKENMLSRDDARDLLETIADAPTVIEAEEGE